MKKSLLFAMLVLTVPSFAMAHISVRPRESKPGAEERYTVGVPTEGAVATTHVLLEIPADVTVLEVLPAEGRRSRLQSKVIGLQRSPSLDRDSHQ